MFVLLADEVDNDEAVVNAEWEAGDNEEDEDDDDELTAELLIIVAMEDCFRAFDNVVVIEPLEEVDDDSDNSFWRNFDVLLFASELFCIFPERLVDEGVFLGVGVGVVTGVAFDGLAEVSPRFAVPFVDVFGLLGCFFFGRYL